MSDATTNLPEAQTDRTLTTRRVIAFGLAIALGLITSALGILLILKAGLDATVPISFVEIPLLPLAALPLTFFFLIWVDYFMKTNILPD
ncbi:MAG TPA: hypothetical protein VMT24_18485 [Aggregatilineaceae bacterium]|nr:hypothetical protein [Aggregatilineaceae bacterium]